MQSGWPNLHSTATCNGYHRSTSSLTLGVSSLRCWQMVVWKLWKPAVMLQVGEEASQCLPLGSPWTLSSQDPFRDNFCRDFQKDIYCLSFQIIKIIHMFCKKLEKYNKSHFWWHNFLTLVYIIFHFNAQIWNQTICTVL